MTKMEKNVHGHILEDKQTEQNKTATMCKNGYTK